MVIWIFTLTIFMAIWPWFYDLSRVFTDINIIKTANALALKNAAIDSLSQTGLQSGELYFNSGTCDPPPGSSPYVAPTAPPVSCGPVESVFAYGDSSNGSYGIEQYLGLNSSLMPASTSSGIDGQVTFVFTIDNCYGSPSASPCDTSPSSITDVLSVPISLWYYGASMGTITINETDTATAQQ